MHYSALKRKKAVIWNNVDGPEIFMLREIGQTQKGKYFMVPLIVESKLVKLPEKQNKAMVPWTVEEWSIRR